jgi:hypothetical protein
VLLLTGLLHGRTIVYRIQRLSELSGRDGLTGLPKRLWPAAADAARIFDGRDAPPATR